MENKYLTKIAGLGDFFGKLSGSIYRDARAKSSILDSLMARAKQEGLTVEQLRPKLEAELHAAKNSHYNTVAGTAAGTVAGVGLGTYGVHRYLKNKENEVATQEQNLLSMYKSAGFMQSLMPNLRTIGSEALGKAKGFGKSFIDTGNTAFGGKVKEMADQTRMGLTDLEHKHLQGALKGSGNVVTNVGGNTQTVIGKGNLIRATNEIAAGRKSPLTNVNRMTNMSRTRNQTSADFAKQLRDQKAQDLTRRTARLNELKAIRAEAKGLRNKIGTPEPTTSPVGAPSFRLKNQQAMAHADQNLAKTKLAVGGVGLLGAYKGGKMIFGDNNSQQQYYQGF